MKLFVTLTVLVLVYIPSSGRFREGQQNPDDRLKARIMLALKTARERVDTNRKELSRDRKTEGPIEGYELQKVIAGVKKGQQTLLEQLEGSELAGLRLYVEKYYPVPSISNLRTNNSERFGPLVEPKSKDDAFKKALSFLATLRFKLGGLGMQETDLSVDLSVNSEPSEALFSLAAAGGESRQTITNNPMTNVFRGVYEYTVTKADFKTGKGEINLVDEEGRSVQCKLVRLDENGDSFCKQVNTP